MERAIKTKPDVAVLGCEPPLNDGIALTREIRAKAPKTEVLFLRRKTIKTVSFTCCKRGREVMS
jgi:DNA-binding NarL/FixJ family response regulator